MVSYCGGGHILVLVADHRPDRGPAGAGPPVAQVEEVGPLPAGPLGVEVGPSAPERGRGSWGGCPRPDRIHFSLELEVS